MKLLFMYLLSAGGLVDSIHAQTNETQSKTDRTCRIVFPQRPNSAPKVAYLFDGKENQKVTLPSMNFSPVIILPKGNLTILMSGAEITDIENLPPKVPSLKIAESIRDFYILVTPDPKNPTLPVKMNLVSASDGKLKAGETLWFNLTEHRILGKLGEAKLLVQPKGRMVSRDPLPTSGYYRAELAYQPEAKGAIQRITEQQWWHDARSRHVGFIVTTGGKLPKIFFFRDFR
ncbi:MAG: hypothetical protein AB8D78_15680 [Akkermansiaceae bacterium]